MGLVFVAGTAASCGDTEEPVRTSIVPAFSMPRGMLDKAKRLELRVLDGQVTCDETTGLTTAGGPAHELVKKDLDSTGCAANAKFCGNVSIDKSSAPRVFEAKAKDSGGGVLAVGCATAKIEQDTAAVTIKMFRFLAPPVCGDGTLQPTEQCEPGGTSICDDACQSKEILLSVGSPGNKTSTGKAGDKTDPFFLWPQGSGDGGRFLALFTDKISGGSGNVEIGLRVMSDDLSPATSPPAVASASILLPNGTSFPPDPEPGRQSAPQGAFLGGKYYIVFQDDNSPGSSGLDVHLRSMNSVFQSGEPPATPIFINGGAQGEPQIQQAPSIAAGADRLFIAWEDAGQGKIVGRTFTPPATLGSQNDISTGTGNTHPQVASIMNRWVTTWRSGTGIKVRVINTDGTPSGGEQVVNGSGAGADGGKIAVLPDGRFAVVWSTGGDIFLQRFDAKGQPIAGDQAQPLNDLVIEGDQTQPTIASTPTAGGSYVVAWHDASTGHIRARVVGGSSGFLFNNVNGQSSEFQASREDGRSRAHPILAVGGAGPFIAIGWEDRSATGAGVVVRRFPLPVE
jgi:hypothetical protein